VSNSSIFLALTLIFLIFQSAKSDDSETRSCEILDAYDEREPDSDCRGWCRGRPLADCGAFWVLETGWCLLQKESNVREEKKRFLFTADVGYMRNITANSAVGATAYVGADDDAGQFGLRLRYRRWLNRDVSLDVSPGILLTGEDNRVTPSFPGFVGTLTLGFADWAGITVLYQAIRYERSNFDYAIADSGTQKSLYIGARFGSYAAIVFPAILLAIYAAESGSDQAAGW